MKENTTLGASVLAAITASLCCIGPFVAALLGLGSFGAAAVFEAWRPYLLGVTGVMLVAAFYLTYRKREVACADGSCRVSSAPRWNKVMLWISTGVVILFAAFPYYSGSLLAALNQHTSQPAHPNASGTARGLTKAQVTVSGMTCNACAVSLKSSLTQIPGVTSAKVSYEKGEALVEYDAGRVTPDQLTEAVEDVGFSADAVKVLSPAGAAASQDQLVTTTLQVEGMTCGGCVVTVRQALAKGEGVKSVDVSLEREQAVVTYDPTKITREQLVEAVNQTGYKAKLENRREDEN